MENFPKGTHAYVNETNQKWAGTLVYVTRTPPTLPTMRLCEVVATRKELLFKESELITVYQRDLKLGLLTKQKGR